MTLFNRTLFLSLAACTAIATPQIALAQSSDDPFTGVSVGLQGGYESHSVDEVILEGANSVTLDDKDSGAIYGGYVGYDVQLNNFVIGVEAGFTPNGTTISDDIANGGSAQLNPKWSANASARAGFVLADRALVYGRAGYNRMRYSENRFVNGNDTAIASINENADGFMFGGGAEVAFNEYASLRVEYRRINMDGSIKSNQVLAGATLRF